MDQFTDTNDVDELRETAAAACQLLASVGLPTQTPDLLLFPVSRADASWPQRKAAYEQLESKVTTASFGGSTVDPWMSIQALEQYLATSTPTPQQQVQRLHAGVTNKFGFDPQLHQARNIGHSRAVTWFLRATSCSAPTSASAHALLSAPTTAVFAQTASLHAAAMLAETADNSSLGSLVNSCRVDASRELLTSMHESMLPASVRIEETETLPQKPTKKVLKKAESAVPAPMSKSLPKKEATATTARKKFVSDSAKPGTEVKKAPAKKKPAKKAPAESSDEVSSSDSELEVPAKAAKKGFGQAAPTSRASTTAPAGGANTDGPMRDLAWKPHSLGLLVLVSRSMAPSTKVAAFDMDSTLIQPKSNSKFPTNRADWKWLSPNVPSRLKQLHDSGYKIVIFTNQSGISKGHQRAEDITGKILDMANEIQVPIHAFVSTANDIHRKPGTAMWDIFITYNGGVIPSKDSSFFVGDAAGRFANPPFRPKKDFSCTDRAFAHNIGIKFQTESEFFFGAKQEKFEWDSLDPATLGATVGQQTSNVVFTKPTQELVIMLGYPGSGKSTFSKKNFVAAGYVHVNQDTLKSQQNCMSATHSALASGKSVVVDNTNVRIASSFVRCTDLCDSLTCEDSLLSLPASHLSMPLLLVVFLSDAFGLQQLKKLPST
jgi:bifunctional polynucleotide phosphatase/kinase